MIPTVIYVLMPDYGYEGLREPIMAFLSKETAEQCHELMKLNLTVPATFW